MPSRRHLLPVAAALLVGLPRSPLACVAPLSFSIMNRGSRPLRSLRVTGHVPPPAPRADGAGRDVPVELPPQGLPPGDSVLVRAVNCRQAYDIVATFADGRVVQVRDWTGREAVTIR